MQPFSTGGLKTLFTYPFRKTGWGSKLLVLAGFYVGGLIIPVFPWLFAYGYTAEMIRRATREEDPDLPEWAHWDELLMDGLRLMGASLFYILPLVLIFGLGFGTYFGTTLGMTSMGERGGPPPWFVAVFLTGLGAFLCSLICGTLFSVMGGLLMPAAITHTVVKRSFAAFFHVGEWWRIIRANLGGYVILFVLLGGAYFIWQLFYALLSWTLVLLPLIFILPFLAAPYFTTVTAVMFGRIYHEAEETIGLAGPQADGGGAPEFAVPDAGTDEPASDAVI